MSKTVLVIGGSGYVGMELCRQIAQRGDQLATLNRSPRPAGVDYEWLQGDITDQESLAKALHGRVFDVIHHVASLPGDTGDPVQMMQVNALGLTHVLDYARKHACGRVVLSSSISAYEWYPATKFSPPDYLPVDEEHPCRPRDIYSTTKRIQELLATTFQCQYGLQTVALRLTAVVGPHGKGGGRGWRVFAEQLAAGGPVQIPHFSLEEVCHYVDVRDVARLHIAAGDHPEAAGQVFNCCGPAAVSGHDFAASLQRHFPGIEVQTGFPWSMAQGGTITFSMNKARRLIGFEPAYALEDTIISIKEWIDEGGLAQEIRAAQDGAFGSGVKV
jgi:nucleoside-diphosphate-sugar epimerase